jgi:hypothetical protein
MKKLIKIIIISFIVICFYSCLNENNNKYKVNTDTINDEYYIKYRDVTIRYNIIIIDGCEYLVGSTNNTYGGYFLTHKGNCKNPLHEQNKVTITDTIEYQLIKK